MLARPARTSLNPRSKRVIRHDDECIAITPILQENTAAGTTLGSEARPVFRSNWTIRQPPRGASEEGENLRPVARRALRDTRKQARSVSEPGVPPPPKVGSPFRLGRRPRQATSPSARPDVLLQPRELVPSPLRYPVSSNRHGAHRRESEHPRHAPRGTRSASGSRKIDPAAVHTDGPTLVEGTTPRRPERTIPGGQATRVAHPNE